MMESKEILIKNIESWITLESEINNLSSILKEKKNDKKEITNYLINIMKSNNIDVFDVGKNKFIYSKRKTKQSISKKFLLENLERILNNTNEAEKITELLVRQVTARVRWVETIKYAKKNGIEKIFEIGAGKVLTGLAKRIDRTMASHSIEMPDQIDSFILV